MKKFPVIISSVIFLLLTTNTAITKEKTIEINNNRLYNHESVKQEAEAAYSSKDYKKAVFYLEKALSKEPKNDMLRFKYAVSLIMQNEMEKGKKEFQYLILNSQDPQVVAGSETVVNQLAEYEKRLKNKPKSNFRVQDAKNNHIIEIDSKNNDNYLCNASEPTIFPDGFFLRWEKEDFPVKVHIPLPPKEFKLKDGKKYVNLVQKAMLKWTAASPEIKFNFTGNAKEANIIIKWHDYFKDSSMWGYAYLPVYNESTGRRETSINLAVRAQPGTARFTNEAVYFSDDELSAIIIHETGHALGLGHSFSRDDIMTVAFHSVFPNYEWKISSRDSVTLKKLYSFPPDSRCVCK